MTKERQQHIGRGVLGKLTDKLLNSFNRMNGNTLLAIAIAGYSSVQVIAGETIDTPPQAVGAVASGSVGSTVSTAPSTVEFYVPDSTFDGLYDAWYGARLLSASSTSTATETGLALVVGPKQGEAKMNDWRALRL